AITPEFLALGDFNGDGKTDVATSNKDNSTVSILLGNGDGTFSSVTTYATGALPLGIAVSDLNNDNIADLVVANLGGGSNGQGSISFFSGKGEGSSAAAQIYTSGTYPIAVAVGAFKMSDNVPGIVAANFFGTPHDTVTLATVPAAGPVLASFSPASRPVATQL